MKLLCGGALIIGLAALTGCAPASESLMTGDQRREMADAMTRTDPLVTGEIPPADANNRLP